MVENNDRGRRLQVPMVCGVRIALCPCRTFLELLAMASGFRTTGEYSARRYWPAQGHAPEVVAPAPRERARA
jgi:hypothetical protein